jgi:hypothetical protein
MLLGTRPHLTVELALGWLLGGAAGVTLPLP